MMIRFLWSGLLVALLSGAAFADTIIETDEYTITYESGSIDPETFNGTAHDLVIEEKSWRGDTVLIDKYSFSSSSDGEIMAIENLALSGVTVIDESDHYELNIGEFTWTDGQIDGDWMDIFTDRVEVEETTPSFGLRGAITVKDIVWSEKGAELLRVENILMNTTEIPNNPYPEIPIADTSLEFRNIVIPVNVDNAGENYRDLRVVGIDEIRFSTAATINSALLKDRINMNMTLFLAADELTDIRFSMGFGVLYETLDELNRLPTNSESTEVAAQLATIGMFFNNANLIVSDKGILDILEKLAAKEGMSRDEMITIAMGYIANGMGRHAPNTYREIAPPIEAFLKNGGTVHATMAPLHPIPLISLIGMLAVPDQIKSLLGLSIEHQP